MSKPLVSSHESHEGSVASYTVGFVLSIVLTIAAYSMTVHSLLHGWALLLALLGLAVVQLFVQLFFFLHLGRGSSARWNVTALAFMLIVVIIVAGGSLWIMTNLNYHHHAAHESLNKYLQSQDGL